MLTKDWQALISNNNKTLLEVGASSRVFIVYGRIAKLVKATSLQGVIRGFDPRSGLLSITGCVNSQ